MNVAPPIASRSTGRLLVFDDDPNARIAYRRLLVHHGFAAEGCGDPDAVVTRAAEGRFNCVIIDIMMRGAPIGYSIIAKLRADPRTAKLPILAMTGFTNDVLEEAMRLGADAGIFKPVLGLSFIPTVNRLLAESRAADCGAARVLIVEDDPHFNDLLEQTLSCETGGPFIIRSCASVHRAAKLLAKWRPHLVILDLSLAGDGNGMALLRDLDARRSAGHGGVIVVSAAQDPKLPPICLNLGADDFLRKPFHTEELVARARAVLRRTRAPMCETRNPLVAGPLRLDLERHSIIAGSLAGPVLTRLELSLMILLFEYHPGIVPWSAAELAVRGIEASGSGEASAPLRALISGMRSKHPPSIAACFATRRGAGIALDVTGFSVKS